MTPDPSHIERRSSWRDEHLDCICGLANGRGGVLEIGREVRREAIGATDLLRLADEIPDKVQSVLSIVVNVHVRSHRGRDYLRIVVPSHPESTGDDRELGTTHKTTQITSPTTQNDPPTTQNTTRKRILDCLRAEPELTRRELAEQIGVTPDGIKYHLRKLKADGSVLRVGSDRAGRWVVADRPADDRETSEGGPEDIPESATTQNTITTTQNTADTTQKTTQEKILSFLHAEPELTRRELAERIGITPDGIKYQLGKLKAAGAIRRVGSDRAGWWEVVK